MEKRFASIWFRYLATDWHSRRQPTLKVLPFVLTSPDHGRMIITAVSTLAEKNGMHADMVVADARAILPSLTVIDDDEALPARVLTGFAKWFVRYSPVAAIDLPGGLILDVTGCCHLWGGEREYLKAIYDRIAKAGYHVQMAIADTIGAAWAMARYGKGIEVIPTGKQPETLQCLPPAALRLQTDVIERLHKLGLTQIQSFISMPAAALRRRFGEHLLLRIRQALGLEEEIMEPVHVPAPYHERLPCMEPIVTATGIEIALKRLLTAVCSRLQQEGKGIRTAVFKGYRVDGKVEQVSIGTVKASYNTIHLYRLFEMKTGTIEPALGIELFTLEAPVVEEVSPAQAKLWDGGRGLEDNSLAELLDRIEIKAGTGHIQRYMPDEHYWPERSFKPSASLTEPVQAKWVVSRPRPLYMLARPEAIEVTAPIPDYPPMSFRYKGLLHTITRADGPERIEQEWWLSEGQHRDYYAVEDEEGHRYWLFRSGHYDAARTYKWFMHGFFA